MDALTKKALERLKAATPSLTRQQLKTIRGQILAGAPDGAMRGLDTLLERRKAYATKIR